MAPRVRKPLQRHSLGWCAGMLACSMACGGDHGSPTVPTSPQSNQTAPSAPAVRPTAAAPTPYTVTGIVTEVNGGPLAGVTVGTNPPGASTTTDAAGIFSLADITQGIVVFGKKGYEPNGWTRPIGNTSAS